MQGVPLIQAWPLGFVGAETWSVLSLRDGDTLAKLTKTEEGQFIDL